MYDPDERLAECPDKDAQKLTSIEVEFAIPVYVSSEQQRRLISLLEEITREPHNIPKEGVHWVGSMGCKPIWSQTDARVWGLKTTPDAPESGEPEYDYDVLHISTSAREFVSDSERFERHGPEEGMKLRHKPVMREKDYLFTVEAQGQKWDAYRFVKDGKEGTLAFCKDEATDKWIIGVMAPGVLTPEEVKGKLEAEEPS